MFLLYATMFSGEGGTERVRAAACGFCASCVCMLMLVCVLLKHASAGISCFCQPDPYLTWAHARLHPKLHRPDHPADGAGAPALQDV